MIVQPDDLEANHRLCNDLQQVFVQPRSKFPIHPTTHEVGSTERLSSRQRARFGTNSGVARASLMVGAACLTSCCEPEHK
ncbi:hypothetical protein BRADI_1g15805v3 [Brachypodium distachyon]|uniref:Uncharacterized protein n=1 Tax=Brachypodium distachyon TaxID=15368 RepID=A0A2K2DJP9_BRADI|nr:hypothetical protein BRADI_1g15805v3 [Brachypodium distachyon]